MHYFHLRAGAFDPQTGVPAPGPVSGDGMLLEDGTSFLLLEDGTFLLLES